MQENLKWRRMLSFHMIALSNSESSIILSYCLAVLSLSLPFRSTCLDQLVRWPTVLLCFVAYDSVCTDIVEKAAWRSGIVCLPSDSDAWTCLDTIHQTSRLRLNLWSHAWPLRHVLLKAKRTDIMARIILVYGLCSWSRSLEIALWPEFLGTWSNNETRLSYTCFLALFKLV